MISPRAIATSGFLTLGGSAPFVPTGIRIVDICQALVDYLNASVLETPCAERNYATEIAAEEIETVRVVVRPAPAGFLQQSAGMQAKQIDYSVNVALFCRAETKAEIDAAINTLQDIEESCRNLKLVGFRGIANDAPVLYDDAFLRESGIFRGLIRATFRGCESGASVAPSEEIPAFVPTGIRVVDICEAMVGYLNSSVLETACAALDYATEIKLEEIEEDRVSVRPSPDGFRQQGVGSSAKQTDYAINITLLRRGYTKESTDAALGVLQDIEEACRDLKLAGFRGISNEMPVVYDEDLMREAGVFRGLVRVTFRGVE